VKGWVSDMYGANYYQNSPIENPQGPSGGDYRVLRGSSWFFLEVALRSAYRGRNSPDERPFQIGFRCVHGTSPLVGSP
jgi:formylglycine-generating enzyme